MITYANCLLRSFNFRSVSWTFSSAFSNKFFDVLRTNNLLVKKTKRYHITTDSKHHFRKYKNLIENAVPLAPEQIWVTDITYVKTEIGYHYLAIVTDAYSKKIMGYCIDDNMRTTLCINALKMACLM